MAKRAPPLTGLPTYTDRSADSIASLAFYCECTVCGRHRPGEPQLQCLYCLSQTHGSCAKAALEMTAQTMEDLGWDRVTSVALASGEAAAAAAATVATSQPALSPTSSSVIRALQGHSPLFQKGGVTTAFMCSTSCALCVTVYPNPNFCQELSELVERDCDALWRRLTTPPPEVAPSGGATPAVPAARTGKRRRDEPCGSPRRSAGARAGDREVLPCSTAASSAVDGAMGAVPCEGLCGDASGWTRESIEKSGLTVYQRAVYLQLRFDAWCRYFTLERATRGSAPLMLPPSHMSVSEEVIESVSDLLTAAGQAERLYMSAAPVGSLVALPHDGIWRGVKPVRRGETNSYLAESMDVISRTSLEPQTTVIANLFGRGQAAGNPPSADPSTRS